MSLRCCSASPASGRVKSALAMAKEVAGRCRQRDGDAGSDLRVQPSAQVRLAQGVGGEGGGVLLNQCLHQLDAMQWITGMPSKVSSEVGIGKWHDIEVEDDVTCYMEFPDGASGMFLSSTGETPGSNRFELSGTKGRLILENDKLVFTKNAVPSDEWCKTSKIGFQQPDTTVEEIPIPPAEDPHAVLMTNFVDAILDGKELIAPGEEGLGSVELANVMLYSGLLGETVDLPMDGAAWESKLNQLIAESTHEKKVVEVSGEDFAASFRR